MSEKSDKKKKAEDEDDKRKGEVSPTDPELTKWIVKLWEDGDPPKEIKVMQVREKGRVLCDPVDTKMFKAGTPMNIEKAIDLANGILKAAQLDCDRMVRKPQSYYVVALDTGRSADSFRKYPLFLRPKTLYLTAADNAGNNEDEDEDENNEPKALALKYIRTQIEAGQWDKEHYGRVFGDVFLLLQGEVKETRGWANELMAQTRALFAEVIRAFREREEAKNMELDREVAREKAKFWLELQKEGVRTGRNLLAQFFGSDDANGPPNGNSKALVKRSRESILVENFLEDCEATGIAIKLFGDWKNTDGTLRLVENSAPGIFTPRQFAILFQVKEGQAPPEALDALMPGSGNPDEVTTQQFLLAQNILTEGTASGLAMLFSIRKEKIAAAAKAANTKPAA